MLNNNIKERPAFTNGMELLLLADLLLILTLPGLNPLKATLLTLVLLSTVLGISLWLYEYF